MKWLLVFIIMSCLPSEKRDNSAIKGDTSADDRGESFYYQYRLGNNTNSVDFAIKIDRARDGELINLQTINLSAKTAINKIPLQRPRYTAGQGVSFYGDSYRGKGGEWAVYLKSLSASIADLNENPPQLSFDSFLKSSRIARGTAIKKLTAQRWRQLASQRTEAPSFTKPPRIPDRLKRWFDNDFNVDTNGLVDGKYFNKLERDRAITIAGNTYYGAVYEAYDRRKECFVQIWGLDDIKVLEFLNDLGNKIYLTTRHSKNPASITLVCQGGGLGDLAFNCIDGVSKDQGVFQIIRNHLAIIEADGSINVYIDAQGACHKGRP